MKRTSTYLKQKAPYQPFKPPGDTSKKCTAADINKLAMRIDRVLLTVEELYEAIVAVLPDTASEGDDPSDEDTQGSSDEETSAIGSSQQTL